MEPLNNIDVIILIGVALSMLVAFIRGFVKEVLSILGLALFVVLTVYLSPLLTPWMNQFIASKLMAQFVVFLLIMAVFYAIWIIGTDKLIAKIRTSTLSFMDRLFGLVFGFLRAVLILGFCFLIVKIVLPEELKDGSLKKSQYFMMAEPCSDMIEKMLPEDFIKFGLIPEFIGRVPVVVTLDALDENALISILKEPKNSLTKQYHRLFELDGVELDFEDDALELVAKKSLERKTGARGLRAIMEGSLMDLMYKIPSDDTIRKCTITKDVVEGTGEPEIVRGEAPASAKTAGTRRKSRSHKKGTPETA